jgi:hypothetical protein
MLQCHVMSGMHKKSVLSPIKNSHFPGRTGTDQNKLSNRIIDLQVGTQKIKGANQTLIN